MKILVLVTTLFAFYQASAAVTCEEVRNKKVKITWINLGLKSSTKPTEPGLTIPNAHKVLENNGQGVAVYRGNGPYTKKQVEQLMAKGVGRIVMFKEFPRYNPNNPKPNQCLSKQVEQERLYEDNGFPMGTESSPNVMLFPMPWKDIKESPPGLDMEQIDSNYKTFIGACKLAVRAMNAVTTSKTPVFFHCSVGEDRTGLLAGLLRIYVDKWSARDAFFKEMCPRGYEGGNTTKPMDVVEAVQESLTPLFVKMATIIKNNNGKIEEKDCEKLPTKDFTEGLDSDILECKPSAPNLKVEKVN